jgi:hypothetical protein
MLIQSQPLSFSNDIFWRLKISLVKWNPAVQNGRPNDTYNCCIFAPSMRPLVENSTIYHMLEENKPVSRVQELV